MKELFFELLPAIAISAIASICIVLIQNHYAKNECEKLDEIINFHLHQR